jgi:DNA-binding GntR family transcriptional regulator
MVERKPDSDTGSANMSGKDGLVERKRGWLVREHSPAEIQARLECRLVLEGYATRLAAAHRSEAILQELYSFAVRLEKPDITGLEYNQVNDHFHQIIIKAAMNPTLETLHSQTQMNYWGLRMPVTFGPEVDQKIHEQHLALIEAIAARDGDRAETIARNHVQLNMKIILESLGMKLNGSLLSFP